MTDLHIIIALSGGFVTGLLLGMAVMAWHKNRTVIHFGFDETMKIPDYYLDKLDIDWDR